MSESTPDRRTLQLEGADGLMLEADEWGTPGDPPVVMLHGGGQNRHAWSSTAARLSRSGYFVFTVDARGHGDSAWDDEARYDMTDMARDLHVLLERFDRAPAVVGASMGGMAAIAAQGLAGERQIWSSVTLVDVTPRMEIDGVLRIVAFMTAHPDGFERLEDAAAAIAAYNPHRPPPSSTEGLRKVLRQKENGRWHWLWDPRFMTSKPGVTTQSRELTEARMNEMAERLHQAARAIAVPTLLVRGALSDLVSDQSVAELQEAVPHARFVDVSHAGHMVAGDNNETFAAEIIGFLGSVTV